MWAAAASGLSEEAFCERLGSAVCGEGDADDAGISFPIAYVSGQLVPLAIEPLAHRGHLSNKIAARALCPAAAAEQPRSAGSAVEGAGTTPRCCRGCGLRQRTGWRADRDSCLLVFRYVTEMSPAKPATIAPWLGWVFRDREIYPDA